MIHSYTLFGDPVDHSLSPKIHSLFAEQVQRRINYSTTHVSCDGLAAAIENFQASGGQGCNITLPHKEQAVNLCDTLDEAARIAGAVNTIRFEKDGSRKGFNTDGSGLVADLTGNLNLDLSNKRILLLGAGGAARGIIYPLCLSGPSSLTIANRTQSKAEQLAVDFAQHGNINATSLESLAGSDIFHGFDLVINSTSAAYQGGRLDLPASILNERSQIYDLSYSRDASVATPFVTWGTEHNCAHCVDGLGMLLEQAADAFFVWEGVRPKTRMISPQIR